MPWLADQPTPTPETAPFLVGCIRRALSTSSAALAAGTILLPPVVLPVLPVGADVAGPMSPCAAASFA